MKKLSICALFILWVSFDGFAQTFAKRYDLQKKLYKVSGLEISSRGNIWMLNDHGKPILYQISSSDSSIIQTRYFKNNVQDWESLTRDQTGNFYIGDIGNNKNRRRFLKIYKIPDPDLIDAPITVGKMIKVSLPNHNPKEMKSDYHEFDFEAMIHYENALYIFSKNRSYPFSGHINIYKIPDKPGTYEGELIGNFSIGKNKNMFENWITGAAFSFEDNVLFLLSHNKVVAISCFPEDQFHLGQMRILDIDHFSQKEAIAYDPKSRQLYIADERTQGIIGGAFYTLDVSQIVEEQCK